MRSIGWLHISDIHTRQNDPWSQSVVMTAVCEDIRIKRADRPIEFVLVAIALARG